MLHTLKCAPISNPGLRTLIGTETNKKLKNDADIQLLTLEDPNLHYRKFYFSTRDQKFLQFKYSVGLVTHGFASSIETFERTNPLIGRRNNQITRKTFLANLDAAFSFFNLCFLQNRA